jgi:hypothetical protein
VWLTLAPCSGRFLKIQGKGIGTAQKRKRLKKNDEMQALFFFFAPFALPRLRDGYF